MHRTPAEYKKEKGYEWLSELDSLALANVQLNYEKAMDAFWQVMQDIRRGRKRKMQGFLYDKSF